MRSLFLTFFIGAVCAFDLTARAQLSADEAARRMAELNKHASTRASATAAPTTQPEGEAEARQGTSPATRPAGPPQLKTDAPENVVAFVRACEADQPKALLKCQTDLKSSRMALAAARNAPPSEQKRAAVLNAMAVVKANEQKLEALQAGDLLQAAPHLQLKTGSIGTMPGYLAAQIVDGNDMLAHLYLQVDENYGTDTMPMYSNTTALQSLLRRVHSRFP
jgi:hypothetical protein